MKTARRNASFNQRLLHAGKLRQSPTSKKPLWMIRIAPRFFAPKIREEKRRLLR